MKQPIQTTLFNIPSKKDEEEFVDKIMEVFNSIRRPKIVMPMYEDAIIPDEFRNQIFVERILLAKNGDNIACEAETLWYLSTVSLSAPFSHSWYRIFLHLFRRWCMNTKKEIPEFASEEIILQDIEKRELKRLREWLYKKSIESIEKGG
jgi:hypothetical protein